MEEALSISGLREHLKQTARGYNDFILKLLHNHAPIPRNGRGSVYHEYIKCAIWEYANKNGRIAFPEHKILNRRRFDIAVYSGSGISALIEIDTWVKENSIRKLMAADRHVTKIIVSIGRRTPPKYKIRHIPPDIIHVDITNETLGL